MILSVITIAYNNLNGLKKTMAVFEEKRFSEEVEIIIVDGNSKDGSKEYLQSQTLSRNWVSEPDKGIYNAMNKGLGMARGDYVWFLNSGDYIENAAVLEMLLQALKKNYDAVYGETIMVNTDGLKLGTRSELSTRKLPEVLNRNSFRMGMNVGHQSFIVKRSLAVFFDESYRYVSDIDWMIRTLENCKTVLNLNRAIACFTMDGFSSKQRKESNRERYRVLRKHYGFVPNLIAHFFIGFRKLMNLSRV